MKLIAILLLTVVALYFFLLGLSDLAAFFMGEDAASNYPGAFLATPAWLLMLPALLFALRRRRAGLKASMWCGWAGAMGTLTMPCAWEPVHRGGLVSGTLLSLGGGLLSYWLLETAD